MDFMLILIMLILSIIYLLPGTENISLGSKSPDLSSSSFLKLLWNFLISSSVTN